MPPRITNVHRLLWQIALRAADCAQQLLAMNESKHSAGTFLEKRLSVEDLRRFSLAFNKDPKNTLALNAVTENGIAAVALSRKEVDRQNFTFSDLIESPDATNQERSGRC
jgi:hypothetical protein